jgi:hypothetical protein
MWFQNTSQERNRPSSLNVRMACFCCYEINLISMRRFILNFKILEFSDYFASLSRKQSRERHDVDVFRNESDRSVYQ